MQQATSTLAILQQPNESDILFRTGLEGVIMTHESVLPTLFSNHQDNMVFEELISDIKTCVNKFHEKRRLNATACKRFPVSTNPSLDWAFDALKGKIHFD